jgi:hypothetical protein
MAKSKGPRAKGRGREQGAGSRELRAKGKGKGARSGEGSISNFGNADFGLRILRGKAEALRAKSKALRGKNCGCRIANDVCKAVSASAKRKEHLAKSRYKENGASSYSSPSCGTDKFRQIFLASRFGISVCRGTASTAPVFGFTHNE